jgi:hypothetical protein
MSKILDIDTWLNIIFNVEKHSKLNQITTIKSYWTKTGEARAPLDSMWKDPKWWGPGETLADQHSWEMHRLLAIEAAVPGVKLGKVDLGYFAFDDIFRRHREYVEIIKDNIIHREWHSSNGWIETPWRIAKIDFGEFQAYAVENPKQGNYIVNYRCIFITVPRININYKPSEKGKSIKTEERLYFVGFGEALYDNKDYTIYKVPYLKYPTQAKDFFTYMQKNFNIFGDKAKISKMMVWVKNQLTEKYCYFPTYNIKNEKDIEYYLDYCKKHRVLEAFFKLPAGISIDYNIDNFVKNIEITQEQVDEYIKLVSSKESPVEIIREIK